MSDKVAVVIIDPTTGLPYTAVPVNIGSTVNRTASGNITSTQSVALSTAACGSAAFQVAGTWTGTLDFEYTIDDTTWNALSVTPDSGGPAVSSTTANGNWTVQVESYSQVRIVGNTVGSGTAAVFLSASTATSVVTVAGPLPIGDNTIGRVKVTDGANVAAVSAGGALSVEASALPLPAGAATAAKQDTGNASLSSIDGKTPALGQTLSAASLPVVIASDQVVPVSGSVQPNNAVDATNSSTTPLGGGATFTGTSRDVLQYAAVEVFAYSDVAGTLYLDFSTNGTNWDLSIPYALTAGSTLDVPSGPHTRYFRVRYVNGGGAQATFRLQTLLLATIPAPHAIPLGSIPTAGDDAVLTQSEIIGLSSGGGGTYVPVKVSPSGAVQVGGTVDIGQTNAASVLNTAPTTQYGLVVRQVPAAATAPSGVELSDGSAFYVAAKTGQLPAALGQASLANSLSVGVNSNQVGTAGAGSATVFTVQGNAGGTPLPVSGTLTVERATAGAPVGVTVSNSAVQVLASNSAAKSRIITNNGSSNVYLGKDNTVTTSGATMGILVRPGGSYSDSGTDMYNGAIYGIGDAVSASQNVSAWERT